MQTTKYIFQPETASIWTWIIIAAILVAATLFLMVRFGKKTKSTTTKSSNPLLFLLAGIGFLLALTILIFNGYNLTQIKPCLITKESISVGKKSLALKNIRKTKIHREGSGIPFKGMGVDKGTSNSLIIEAQDGRTMIISADFYPINEINNAIRKVKGTGKQG